MEKSIVFDSVADLYDFYVNTSHDVSFYLNEFKDRDLQVLELMCGTGRVSLPLIESGIKLTGVDYAPAMIKRLEEKLRAKGLGAKLVEADARTFELGREFDAVFIPFNSFMELVGAKNQHMALRQIHKHLKHDGVFICTLHNPAQRLQAVTGRLSFIGEHNLPDGGKLAVSSVERYFGESGIVKGVQYFEIYDETGYLKQKRRLEIMFNLIRPDDFEDMIKNAGFRVRELYGDYDKSTYDPASSPFLIYFLSKFYTAKEDV